MLTDTMAWICNELKRGLHYQSDDELEIEWEKTSSPPKKVALDIVEKDFEKIGMHNWRNLIHDREKWSRCKGL